MSQLSQLSPAHYALATRVLSPALRLWCAWRAWRQPIYRAHRHERWAQQLPAPVCAELIWLHAVSVGETQACAPLLRAFLRKYSAHAVLLTHMTPTGRDTGAALFAAEIAAGRVQQCYLPYDIAGLPTRFLQHFKPELGMLMETEVWPNVVAESAKAGLPLGLANGRMSDKTLRGSLRFKRLSCATYESFTWLAAQSLEDAARFGQLRAKPVTVTGNLKFDVSPDAAQLAAGRALKAQLARPTIALASTREGEEALLLPPVLAHIAAQPPAGKKSLILLIPRHPKRTGELQGLLQSMGVSFAVRSAGQLPTADTAVYLCDTLGEMWCMYGAADTAIVGGGWLPLGGQNLIEPCAAGCATVVGAHMFNFEHATQLALQGGAVVQCSSTRELMACLSELENTKHRQSLIEAGQRFAAAHTGATQAHLGLIDLI